MTSLHAWQLLLSLSSQDEFEFVFLYGGKKISPEQNHALAQNLDSICLAKGKTRKQSLKFL